MIGDHWGATPEEVEAGYPCDRYVDGETLQAWRAATVAAPPEVVWAWLLQVRLAPYSYDWIDNLGHRSPGTLMHLTDPVPGDPFTASGGRPLGRVLAVEHAEHLTARIMGTALTYRLTALGPDRTRLVLKVVSGLPRVLAPALALGDLVMARRQLLNFKRYAEATAA